MKRKSIGE